MALALVVAMVAASLVAPVGHAQADGFRLASASAASDDGSGPEAGHDAAACHGCLGHAAAVLSSPAFAVSAQVTETDFAARNDTSPPTPARVPPVEPPRA